jgi:uncharacterized membrane protein
LYIVLNNLKSVNIILVKWYYITYNKNIDFENNSITKGSGGDCLKLRRILLTAALTLMFVLGNTGNLGLLSVLKTNDKYTVAYAAPKGSSGGFKSGSFRTAPKSSTGGFKSGSFSATPKSSSGSYSGSSYSYPRSRTVRSFIPFPIPIPFFGGSTYMGSWLLGGIFDLIKLILLFVLIYIVIKNLRKRR